MIINNKLPTVAIVGKPNVGKSTLLNNLCGKRVAITDDKPGVTRDRKYFPANLFGWQFIAIDTAGWDDKASNSSDSIHKKMLAQTMLAIQEADIVIVVIDGKNGISSLDHDFINIVRKNSKQWILTINKTESSINITSDEIYRLGMGDPVYISSAHSIGLGELHQRLVMLFPQSESDYGNKYRLQRKKAQQEIAKDYDIEMNYDSNICEDNTNINKKVSNKITTITLCGRPNVGKSTIFNALLSEERSIVDSEAGTTRDAIAASLRFTIDHQQDEMYEKCEAISNSSHTQEQDYAAENENNSKFDTIFDKSECDEPDSHITEGIIAADICEIELVDTAGMRKRGKVKQGRNFEFSSVGQSIASIRRSDIAVLVMDADDPLERQDLSIAKMIINEGKGIILVFNKIDKLSRTDLANLKHYVEETLPRAIPEIINPPVLYISAIKKINIGDIAIITQIISKNWTKQLNTSLLNRWLERVTKEHFHARGKNNRQVKIKHINQIASRPPTFQIFSNMAESVHSTYISYLRQKIAERFGIFGTPIRFVVKESSNPYENKSKNSKGNKNSANNNKANKSHKFTNSFGKNQIKNKIKTYKKLAK